MKWFVFLSMLFFLTGSLAALTGFGDSTINVELDETIPDDPLPVELSSFTAALTSTRFIELRWVSEAEYSMLGYNVYRGINGDLSEALKISLEIIPAYNYSFSTNYSFVDEDVVAGNVFFYWLQAVNLDLTNKYFGPLSVIIDDQEEDTPLIFITSLGKNYPNPFNPNTIIEYSIREETEAVLRIYNVRGQIVKTLFSGVREAGNYREKWNSIDSQGREVASGVYLYRLTTDHYDRINKMLLVK
jgi:hypothetical protein